VRLRPPQQERRELARFFIRVVACDLGEHGGAFASELR
jgi:hypothetical protein